MAGAQFAGCILLVSIDIVYGDDSRARTAGGARPELFCAVWHLFFGFSAAGTRIGPQAGWSSGPARWPAESEPAAVQRARYRRGGVAGHTAGIAVDRTVDGQGYDYLSYHLCSGIFLH